MAKKSKNKEAYWVIKNVDTDEYWLSRPGGDERWGTNKMYRLRFETRNEAKSFLRDLQDECDDELKVVKVSPVDSDYDGTLEMDENDPDEVQDTWFSLQNPNHSGEFWSSTADGWVDESDEHDKFDDPYDAYVTAGKAASKHDEVCYVVQVDLLGDDSTRVKHIDLEGPASQPIPVGTVFIFKTNPNNPFIVSDPPRDHESEEPEVWHISLGNGPTCYGTVQEFLDEIDEGIIEIVYEP